MSEDNIRTLSLKDSVSIVAGSMIGCGIFIVSADILRQVQTAWLLLIVWLIAGLISLSGAMAYGELANNITEEGGQYIYLKKIYNECVAFLYGWSLFLIIQSATIAAVCIAFAKFIGIIIPFINSELYLININDIHLLSTQQIFAVITCLTITYINSKGIKYGLITQHIFTITKIASMIAVIICGIAIGLNWDVIHNNFPVGFAAIDFSPESLEIIATATVGSIFAMVTWNNLTFIAGEIKEPEKNIPKALIYGVGLVVILYLFINCIYTITTPVEYLKNAPEDIVAAASMSYIFAKFGSVYSRMAEIIISIIIMISAFGCVNGMIMTGARVYYKMAKDKLFFRSLALINRKTKVPSNSLWCQGICISILILFCGNYSELLDYVIYAALIFYVLTTAGIFIYRYKAPLSEQKLRINSFYGIFFTITSSFIIYSLTIHKTVHSLRALILILAGLIVYFIRKKIKSTNNNLNKSK